MVILTFRETSLQPTEVEPLSVRGNILTGLLAVKCSEFVFIVLKKFASDTPLMYRLQTVGTCNLVLLSRDVGTNSSFVQDSMVNAAGLTLPSIPCDPNAIPLIPSGRLFLSTNQIEFTKNNFLLESRFIITSSLGKYIMFLTENLHIFTHFYARCIGNNQCHRQIQ